jgi:hypothetical protein
MGGHVYSNINIAAQEPAVKLFLGRDPSLDR